MVGRSEPHNADAASEGLAGAFRVGQVQVDPRTGTAAGPGRSLQLDPKLIEVLVQLAAANGEVVTREALMNSVWPGVVVTDFALSRCIYQLRKNLAYVAADPEPCIETLPKRGYRLLWPVSDSEPRSERSLPPRPRRRYIALGSVLLALLIGIAWTASRYYVGAEGSGGPDKPVITDRSIAVLPFVSYGPQEDDLRLADAMHEEVLTRLAGIASLTVISNNSVEKYRGTDLPLSQVARELSVATILMGSVQRVGNQVRIRTQLIDAESDKYLWAWTFDRELTAGNVFAIQTEIAENVAQSLRASLSHDESVRVSNVPTESFEAYQAVLEGHLALKESTPGSFQKAMEHYERALQLSPGFAEAYLAMAKAYWTMVEQRAMPESEATEKIEAYARAALNLNPNLGIAYHHLGQIRRVKGHYDEAEALSRTALKLEPGNVWILHGLGLTLRLQGRALESVPYYNRAVEIDPLSPIINESRGSLLRDLGRFEDAEKQYRVALAIDPEFVNTYWGLGTLYWSMGKPEQAITWFENAVRLAPGGDVFRSWLALMYLELEQDEQARAAIDDAMRVVPVDADNDVVLIEELLRIYRGLDASELPDGRRFMFRYWYGGLLDLPVRALLEGRFEAAIEEYENLFPRISSAEAVIDGSNVRAAIYVAFALDQLGKRQQAVSLLDQAETCLTGMQRLGVHGYWVSDAQIQAIRGDHAESIKRLEAAVEEGWRNLWRFYLMHDPILQALHTQRRYEALVRRVQDDMVGRNLQE